jgi:hypothetical protein
MVSGEEGLLTKVLLTIPTEDALSAGVVEPCDADAITSGESMGPGAHLIQNTDDLMTGYHRMPQWRQFSLDDV